MFYAVYKVYRRDAHLSALKIVRLLREVLLSGQAVDAWTVNGLMEQSVDVQVGYFVGVVDALTSFKVLCHPKGVTYWQGWEIVRAYVQRTPQVWHLSGAEVVMLALGDTWPCQSRERYK